MSIYFSSGSLVHVVVGGSVKTLLACMRVVGDTDYMIVLWCYFLGFHLRCQCFAGMSIYFFSGEFLALADVLFLGEVMPNFSGDPRPYML